MKCTQGEALMARSLFSIDLELIVFDFYVCIVSCLSVSARTWRRTVWVSVIATQSTVSSTSARTSQTTQSVSTVNINDIFIYEPASYFYRILNKP